MNRKTIISSLGTALLLILVSLYVLSDFETTELDASQRQQLGVEYVNLKHGATHYQLTGPQGAETVVLVHGFSIPSYLWDDNVDSLVNAGYRVLRFDLYGRGFTERPDLDYTLDVFVEQLEDLLEALNIQQPFHLVGLSMGAAISARYSVRHPQAIKTLSLLAPLVATPSRLDVNLLAIPGLGEYLACVVMMPKLKNNLANTVYEADSYPEWEQRLEQHIHFKGYRRALLSTLRNLAGQSEMNSYRALGKSEIPVQLIWGRQDPIADYSQAAQLQSVMPNLILHTLEQTGHLPQIEQAEVVNRLLLGHFSLHASPDLPRP